MEAEYKELGSKLRVYRKNRLLLTQEQLADRLQIKQENISKSENGILNPKNVIEKISKHFNIDKSQIEDIETEKAFNIYGNIENSNIINTVNVLNYNQIEDTSLDTIKSTLQELVKCVDFLIKKEKF